MERGSWKLQLAPGASEEQAAGALAAHCLELRTTPRSVRNREASLSEFQKRLRSDGFGQSSSRAGLYLYNR